MSCQLNDNGKSIVCAVNHYGTIKALLFQTLRRAGVPAMLRAGTGNRTPANGLQDRRNTTMLFRQVTLYLNAKVHSVYVTARGVSGSIH